MEPFALVAPLAQEFSHLEGSAMAVGELGNGAGSGGALDLDRSVDNIANLEGAEAATGVGSSGCLKATVFC